ncbi:unnamed protein product [Durusdinium trenchii]|uniref:Uncharacterized protein n=1 Tax=Durusdinium trenchii TaxID=1381693 RepID=A0ABP0IUJ2_9DINO
MHAPGVLTRQALGKLFSDWIRPNQPVDQPLETSRLPSLSCLRPILEAFFVGRLVFRCTFGVHLREVGPLQVNSTHSQMPRHNDQNSPVQKDAFFAFCVFL